jgi:hypothetical protein
MNRNIFRSVLVIFLSVLAINFSAHANFAGYVRETSDTAGNFLNVSKNNKISLEKERLIFTLGYKVDFKGTFWFKNLSQKKQEIILAFPQASFWDAKYDDGVKNYVPDKYYPLNADLKINGKKMKFESEKVSLRKTGEPYGPKDLLPDQVIKKEVIRYAGAHEAEEPPSLPIILWYLKKTVFMPGEIKKIEISFERPWFYQDNIWGEFAVESDGKRYFNYITETARTWAHGTIKDFEAQIIYPQDAKNYISFYPEGWESDQIGNLILKKKNWSPGPDDEIKFIWQSKYEIVQDIAHQGDPSCNDYLWRYLFDGSAKTAWCANMNIPDPKRYGVRLLDNHRNLEIKKIKMTIGFAGNPISYKQYARPKKILFYDSEDETSWDGKSSLFKVQENIGWQKVIDLKDIWEPQVFDLGESVYPGSIVNFKILETYAGEKSQDVFISELDFE